MPPANRKAMIGSAVALGGGVLVLAAYILWVRPYLAVSRETMARRAWAAEARSLFDSRRGLSLATLLQSCLGNSRPASAEALMTDACRGLGPVRAGSPAPGRSTGFDYGWRWDLLTEGEAWRVVVAPDPALGVPGPAFEIDSARRVLRRENFAAPAFFVWRGLALVASYRSCLIAAREQAIASGSWTGKWEPLVRSFAQAGGCPDVNAEAGARTFEGLLQVTLLPIEEDQLPQGVPVVIDARDPRQDSFSLQVLGPSARYLLDVRGAWHSTRDARPAGADDPAPASCETDLTSPCDEPGQ